MARYIRPISILLILAGILTSWAVFADGPSVWDCPNCGRTGNTGNFCGKCAYSRSWLTTPETDFEYSVENDTAVITKYTGNGSHVTVPAAVGGIPVSVIGDKAFYRCGGLEEIRISEGLTAVGKEAFYHCDSLAAVSLPDSMKTIGSAAFYGCGELGSLYIPAGVESIGAGCFRYCGKLTSVEVSPDNPHFRMENGLLIRGDILECRLCAVADTECVIPAGIKTIRSYAFDDCESLVSIAIPESVTSIGGLAFSECRGLISIDLPDGLASVGTNPFRLCESLTRIGVSSENSLLEFRGGSLIRKKDGVMIGCVSAFSEDAYEIPEGICAIGDYAFYRSGIRRVTIPGGVTDIGTKAFQNCKDLLVVVMPDSVRTIAEDAFSGCGALTVVGGKGTYAEEYCSEHQIAFMPFS